MKSIFVYFALFTLIVPLGLFSQGNPLDSFIAEYSGKQGFYFLDLNTNMLSSICKDEPGDNSKVVHIKMISYDESQGNNLTASEIYDAFFNRFDKNKYIGLVSVKSSEEKVEIMVKKEDERVSEFIIAIREDKGMKLIAATGNFDLKDLAKLKSLHNCHGMKIIKQMCEE